MAQRNFAERVAEIRDQYQERLDNIERIRDYKREIDQEIKEAYRFAKNAQIEAYAHFSASKAAAADKDLTQTEKEVVIAREAESAKEWNDKAMALMAEIETLQKNSDEVGQALRSAIAVNFKRRDLMNEINEEHSKNERPIMSRISQLWRSTIFYRAFKTLQMARLNARESMESTRERMVEADTRAAVADAERRVETEETYDKVADIVNNQEKSEPAKVMSIAHECAETGQDIAVNVKGQDGKQEEAEFTYDQTDDVWDPENPGTSGVVTIHMQDGRMVASIDTTTKNIECPEGMHNIKTSKGRQFFIDDESLDAIQELIEDKTLTPIEPDRRKERLEEQQAAVEEATQPKSVTEIVKQRERFHLLESEEQQKKQENDKTQEKPKIVAEKAEAEVETEKSVVQKIADRFRGRGTEEVEQEAPGKDLKDHKKKDEILEETDAKSKTTEEIKESEEPDKLEAEANKTDEWVVADETPVKAETNDKAKADKEQDYVDAVCTTVTLKDGNEVKFYSEDQHSRFVENAINGTFKDKDVVQNIRTTQDRCKEEDLVESKTNELMQIRDVVRRDLSSEVPSEDLAPRSFNNAAQYKTALLQKHNEAYKEALENGREDVAAAHEEAMSDIQDAYERAGREGNNPYGSFISKVAEIASEQESGYTTKAVNAIMSEAKENGVRYIDSFLDYGFKYDGKGGPDKDNTRMTKVIQDVVNANSNIYVNGDMDLPVSEMKDGEMTDYKIVNEKQILDNIGNIISKDGYLYEISSGKQLAIRDDKPWEQKQLGYTQFVKNAAAENREEKENMRDIRFSIRDTTRQMHQNGIEDRDNGVPQTMNAYQISNARKNLIRIDEYGSLGFIVSKTEDRVLYNEAVKSDGTPWRVSDIDRGFASEINRTDADKESEAYDFAEMIKENPEGPDYESNFITMSPEQVRKEAEHICCVDYATLQYVDDEGVRHDILHENGEFWNIGEINGDFMAKTDNIDAKDIEPIEIPDKEARQEPAKNYFEQMRDALAREAEEAELESYEEMH